jgi:hypothetical protein
MVFDGLLLSLQGYSFREKMYEVITTYMLLKYIDRPMDINVDYLDK